MTLDEQLEKVIEFWVEEATTAGYKVLEIKKSGKKNLITKNLNLLFG